MLTGGCGLQVVSSVSAAMTDGPFEIGDCVVSLSSSSQGPPLGLRGLVRCSLICKTWPSRVCRLSCSTQSSDHDLLPDWGPVVQIVGIYDEACEVLFDEVFPGGNDLQGRYKFF